MPNVVFCDNKDCIFYDDYHECCNVDKLVIERGLCMGSPRSGRNVSENDLDEKLKIENVSLKAAAQVLGERCDKYKEENVMLRELVKTMWRACPVDQRDCYSCKYSTEGGDCWLYINMCDLGIEVDK